MLIYFLAEPSTLKFRNAIRGQYRNVFI